MRSLNGILITALIINVSWCAKISSASSPRTIKNLTKTSLEDDIVIEDDVSSLTDETPFKERYRRLIPYMTYYVSNNYVNSPKSQSPGSFQSRIPPPVIKRRFQYSGNRNGNLPNNVIVGSNLNKNINNNNKNGNQYYVNHPQMQQDKFIPSLQYDPKDMDNEEYFTPVIHNQKLNIDSDDYQLPMYQRYQTSRPVLTQTTTTSAAASNLHSEQQHLHFTTMRPTTINFTPKYGDILVRKETQKSQFIQRPTQKPFKYVQGEETYFTDEFEPLRFARPQVPQPFRLTEQPGYPRPRKPSVNLNHIVKSLQLTNKLPEMLNADNIDESIKTLVEILSLLNNGRKNEVAPVFGQGLVSGNSPQKYGDYENYEIVNTRPKITPTKIPFEEISRPIIVQNENQGVRNSLNLDNGPYHVDIIDVGSKEYLPGKIAQSNIEQQQFEKVNLVESTTPINDYKIKEEITEDILQDEMIEIHSTTTEDPGLNYPPPDGAVSHTQNFPPTSVKYGATRGKPNVDYPAYATIPKTEFSCKTQRYKGFFGDPATGCQVWHYCDLNGGMSSFLCPNGTIFSQVALTCDWWFNVKCESTTQLYVLNERLYKYILPVMPKFPEDFSGPEVDRYLELKFMEMETKLREKKLRKQQAESQKTKNTPQIQNDSRDSGQ